MYTFKLNRFWTISCIARPVQEAKGFSNQFGLSNYLLFYLEEDTLIPILCLGCGREALGDAAGHQLWYVLSEFRLPFLNQVLSSETCLGSIDSQDIIQGSLYRLKEARLMPKS